MLKIFLICVLLIRIAKDIEGIDANNINCAGGSQGGGFATMCRFERYKNV